MRPETGHSDWNWCEFDVTLEQLFCCRWSRSECKSSTNIINMWLSSSSTSQSSAHNFPFLHLKSTGPQALFWVVCMLFVFERTQWGGWERKSKKKWQKLVNTSHNSGEMCPVRGQWKTEIKRYNWEGQQVGANLEALFTFVQQLAASDDMLFCCACRSVSGCGQFTPQSDMGHI